jgi:short-subunit dehydrogenase
MDVCAVIGAGPGIGAAVARRFARSGMQTALLSRRPHDLAREVGGKGFECDAERASSIDDALRAVEHDLGPVDVLVYNAAVAKPGSPLEVGAEQLVRELRVDVVGLLVAAQHVVPGMRQRGKGTILVTGGGLALDPWPKMASLAVGKSAVRSLALSLHKELAPQRVHAATVTVCGIVERGSRFDPDKIAEVYWELHSQQPGAFEGERVLR